MFKCSRKVTCWRSSRWQADLKAQLLARKVALMRDMSPARSSSDAPKDDSREQTFVSLHSAATSADAAKETLMSSRLSSSLQLSMRFAEVQETPVVETQTPSRHGRVEIDRWTSDDAHRQKSEMQISVRV